MYLCVPGYPVYFVSFSNEHPLFQIDIREKIYGVKTHVLDLGGK